MKEQNPKIDGRTRRAANIALAKRQISPASYRALVEEGTITLQQAKSMGRNGAPATDTGRASDGPESATEASRSTSGADDAHTPPQPVSRISRNDRSRECMCGCERQTRGLFAPGHDARMFRVAREHLTEGHELTDEQHEYLESSGKMQRVRTRLAEEDVRRREIEARKTNGKGD
jgi:hypothetical protein